MDKKPKKYKKIALLASALVAICAIGATTYTISNAAGEFNSIGVIDSNDVVFDARAFEVARTGMQNRANAAYMEAYSAAYARAQAKTANIVYEYHHHYDGNGNEITVEDYISPIPGGCYTEPVYHTHTDACYTIVREKHAIIAAHDYGGQIDNGNNRFMCDGFPVHYYSADDYLSGKACWHEKRILNCNKAGQLEGYRCTCGKKSGQIVSATITFN